VHHHLSLQILVCFYLSLFLLLTFIFLIVTSTTHKTLRGPRAGIIFYRKDERQFETKINWAVFPALQGGPHEHQIAGIATQMLEVCTPEFKSYARQVISNSKTLAKALIKLGYKLATDGTDNHLVLWDVRPLTLTGAKVENVGDRVCITVNKNAVLGDRSALSPGGVRLGAAALTSRGLVEKDFEVVAQFLHRVVQITLSITKRMNPDKKLLKDFINELDTMEKAQDKELIQLKTDVNTFARKFSMPGL
jgi:glycine hydroxymethyltransferase